MVDMRVITTIFLLFVALISTSCNPLNTGDIRCLAIAMYNEASGEPVKGAVAVAHVVLNRLHSAKFPDTVCGVVYQPHQFSFVDRRIIKDTETYFLLYILALQVYIGNIPDPTNGAMWYHSKDVKPYWAKLGTGERIGNHIFYRSIKK